MVVGAPAAARVLCASRSAAPTSVPPIPRVRSRGAATWLRRGGEIAFRLGCVAHWGAHGARSVHEPAGPERPVSYDAVPPPGAALVAHVAERLPPPVDAEIMIARMKVNLGCGNSYIEGWVNVDSNPAVRADVYMEAFEFVRAHGAEVDELYMGHFLEHLMPASASALLALIADELPEGARVSAVVPDMRAIFAAYDAGEISNLELNDRYVYSYEQPSHHVWCHDAGSLAAVFDDAGYRDVQPIDPLTWEPVFWKDGPESRWQCGVRAVVPASSASSAGSGRRRTCRLRSRSRSRPTRCCCNRIRKLRAEVESLQTEAQPTPRPSTRSKRATSCPRLSSRRAPVEAGGPAGSMFDRLPRSVVPVARRLLPVGSRQRRLARFSVESARVGRSYVERLRHEWVRAGLRRPGTPTYDRWRQGHDVGRGAACAPPSPVRRRDQSAVRERDRDAPGSGTDLDRTLRSLVRQAWSHWRATVVGDPSGADAVRRVSDDRIEFRLAAPEAVIKEANVVLAAGRTRLRDDGRVRRPAAPRTASSRIVQTATTRPARRSRVLGRRPRRRPRKPIRSALSSFVVAGSAPRRQLPRLGASRSAADGSLLVAGIPDGLDDATRLGAAAALRLRRRRACGASHACSRTCSADRNRRRTLRSRSLRRHLDRRHEQRRP